MKRVNLVGHCNFIYNYNSIGENNSNTPVSNNSINKIQENKIINVWTDYFTVYFCNSPKNHLLNNVQNYIQKKSSIEYIIHKMNDIDKMKFVLFSEPEICILNQLEKPSLIYSDIYTSMNSLWSKFEFQDSKKGFNLDLVENYFNSKEETQISTRIKSLLLNA
jgi:hypothetical protein